MPIPFYFLSSIVVFRLCSIIKTKPFRLVIATMDYIMWNLYFCQCLTYCLTIIVNCKKVIPNNILSHFFIKHWICKQNDANVTNDCNCAVYMTSFTLRNPSVLIRQLKLGLQATHTFEFMWKHIVVNSCCISTPQYQSAHQIWSA